jgi:hypothetical protein
MAPGLAAGKVHRMRGFCTHAFLLRGKPLSELEKLLGYRAGRLAAGARVLFLEDLPTVDDFQLAGYTYFSDGALRGHKVPSANRDPYRMESLLKTEQGWSDLQLRAYKQKMIGTKLVISGHERLAKIDPLTPPTADEQYPPGEGIFQVKIVRPLRFREKDTVSPGQTWRGNYI